MKTQQQKIIYLSLLSVLIFIILPLVLYYGKYNAYMLWAIPFGIGFCLSLLVSLYKKPNLVKLIGYSFLVLILITISSIIFAGEGAICYLIIGLFILIPYYKGIIIGYYVQKKIWLKNTILILVFVTIFTSATIENKFKNSIVVKDELIINTSSKELWNNLTSPISFGNSPDFFFSNGVSYPTKMCIVNINGNKYLNCNYSNGVIMAPIIEYNENNSFAFTFSDSIITMKEKNFYNESKTMHIKNHFIIDYGSFEIIKVDSNISKLVTTTSFRHKFEPEFYTNFWVEYFIHNVHKHVLENLKIKLDKNENAH